MRWEKAIEKLKLRFKCGFGFGFGLEKEAMQGNRWANLELWTRLTHQNSNQTIHKAQRHEQKDLLV